MIQVYVWYALKRVGQKNVGHASMAIGAPLPTSAYISWWPTAPETELWPPQTARLPLRPLAKVIDRFYDEWFFRFGETHDFKTDNLSEGGPPNEVISFRLLDGEQAILRWWSRWRARSRFFFALDKNCSTTVAHALQAGGAETYALAAGWISRPPGYVWRPATVAAYAKAIRTGLAFNGIRHTARLIRPGTSAYSTFRGFLP